MATEPLRLPGNGTSGWGEAVRALATLNQTGLAISPVGSSPLSRAIGSRAGVESTATKAALKEIVPIVDCTLVVDGTGSMSGKESLVQAHVAPFIVKVLQHAFEDMPPEVRDAINQERVLYYKHLVFGDGAVDGFSSNRIDNPYLRATSGVLRLDGTKALGTQLSPLLDKVTNYEITMNGGGNTGEASADALLAAHNLLPNSDSPRRRLQVQLLETLRQDCQSLKGQRGRKPDHHDDVTTHLAELVANGVVPPQALMFAGDGAHLKPTDRQQIIFLVTDEPATDALTKIQNIVDLKLPHALLAIITPSGSLDHHGAYPFWQSHLQALDAQWFDLSQLAKADANPGIMNTVGAELQRAVAGTVSTAVTKQILPLLTSGNGTGTRVGSGPIVTR